MNVITWTSPRSEKINTCEECEADLKKEWPKDGHREEFCSVETGLYKGKCDQCCCNTCGDRFDDSVGGRPRTVPRQSLENREFFSDLKETMNFS